MDINNIIEQIKPIDRQKVEEAQNRFDNLIKPVGSLAKLEAMVSRYAGIIGSADKKSVQYPKKALFLWSADTDSVAKAMQEELPVVLLVREAKAEVYPLLVTSCNLEEALEEGAILTKNILSVINCKCWPWEVWKNILLQNKQKHFYSWKELNFCKSLTIR